MKYDELKLAEQQINSLDQVWCNTISGNGVESQQFLRDAIAAFLPSIKLNAINQIRSARLDLADVLMSKKSGIEILYIQEWKSLDNVIQQYPWDIDVYKLNGDESVTITIPAGAGPEKSDGNHRALLKHDKSLMFAWDDPGPFWVNFEFYFPSLKDQFIWFDFKSASSFYGDFTVYASKYGLDFCPNGSHQNIIVPINVGRWYDLTVQVKRSTGNDGFINAWLDDKQVVKYVGQTRADNPDRANFMIRNGIYWGTQNRPDEYSTTIGKVVIGKGEGSLEEFNNAI